jgi:hypothetical protein
MFRAALLPLDVWRVGAWSPRAAASRRSRLMRCAIMAADMATSARAGRHKPRLRVSRGSLVASGP